MLKKTFFKVAEVVNFREKVVGFFFCIKQKDFIETKQQKTKQRLAQPFFFNYNSKTKRTATPIKRTKKITSKRPLS